MKTPIAMFAAALMMVSVAFAIPMDVSREPLEPQANLVTVTIPASAALSRVEQRFHPN